MEVPDAPDEAPNAEDELTEGAFDRELALRLDEELREDEAKLEDDLEEQVVGVSGPDLIPGNEAAQGSGVYASLEEPSGPNAIAQYELGPDEEEFVCRSCFLVKRRTQLANSERLLCVDCART
jgi:hypothetical protein